MTDSSKLLQHHSAPFSSGPTLTGEQKRESVTIPSQKSYTQELRKTASKGLYMPNHEPPTIPPKTLKEIALKRHEDAIQHALTEAKNLGEKQAVQELITRVRKHIEAQHILARDLLNEEHQ